MGASERANMRVTRPIMVVAAVSLVSLDVSERNKEREGGDKSTTRFAVNRRSSYGQSAPQDEDLMCKCHSNKQVYLFTEKQSL